MPEVLDGRYRRRVSKGFGEPRKEQWIDIVLALGAVGLAASILRSLAVSGGLPWVLAGLHGAPIVLRRGTPRWAFAMSTAAGLAFVAGGWPMVGLGLAGVVMVYSLAAYADRLSSAIGLVAAALGLVVAVDLTGGGPDTATIVGNI